MREIILLVIGSVTAKQYEPIRLFHINNGRKPKIVRLSPNTTQAILQYVRVYREFIELLDHPSDAIKELIRKDTGFTVTHHNCDSVYSFEAWKHFEVLDDELGVFSHLTGHTDNEYVVREDDTIQYIALDGKSPEGRYDLMNW